MRFGLLLAWALAAVPLAGQAVPTDPAVRDSVLATVGRLFEGMRTHDSALMRSSFARGAMMVEVPRTGAAVAFESLDGLLAAVAKPGEPWVERVFDPEIRVDGGLATYFAYYTFSLGEKFLHCGVDAFWLMRTDAGWRIAGITHTRRTTGCERR